MTRFYDYDFIKYAFGNPDLVLTDDRLLSGLNILAVKLAADTKLKGDNGYINNASAYLIKTHKSIVKWVSEDYDLAGLNLYKDFTRPAEEFYSGGVGNSLKLTLNATTQNQKISDYMMATELMKYYFKSGACIRSKDNKMAHRYDSLFMNIDSLTCDDNEKDHLKSQLAIYKDTYPTHDQLLDAYRDYVRRIDAEGLEASSFTSLTGKEKTAIVKNVDSVELRRNIKNEFFRILNCKTLSKKESDLIDDKPVEGIPQYSAQYKYEKFLATEKNNGDELDRENIEKILNLIKTVDEIHKNRPWYQRFFGYYGEVGKENKLISGLKRELFRRNIPARELDDALNGDKQEWDALVRSVPTKEERIASAKRHYMGRLYDALDYTGDPDEMRAVEDDDAHTTLYINNVRVRKEDYTYFFGELGDFTENNYKMKSAEEIEKKEIIDIGKDFEDLKEIKQDDFADEMDLNYKVKDEIEPFKKDENDAPVDEFAEPEDEILK